MTRAGEAAEGQKASSIVILILGLEGGFGTLCPPETTHARRPLRDCSAASLPLPAAAEPACSLPAEHARSAHTVSESASV